MASVKVRRLEFRITFKSHHYLLIERTYQDWLIDYPVGRSRSTGFNSENGFKGSVYVW